MQFYITYIRNIHSYLRVTYIPIYLELKKIFIFILDNS